MSAVWANLLSKNKKLTFFAGGGAAPLYKIKKPDLKKTGFFI
jgi:hypothetical protein